jgi:hypothetical protein
MVLIAVTCPYCQSDQIVKEQNRDQTGIFLEGTRERPHKEAVVSLLEQLPGLFDDVKQTDIWQGLPAMLLPGSL